MNFTRQASWIALLMALNMNASFAEVAKELGEYFKEFDSGVRTTEQYKEIKKAISQFRYPAQNHNTEAVVSSKMAGFRTALIACRTGECINGLFVKLEKDYDAFEKSKDFNNPEYLDYRYFGARILPAAKMAGYVWRMVAAVEKIRPVQEMLVGALRSVAEEIKIHAPDSHNEAIFHFLTEPQVGHLVRFENEKMVQDFYGKVILPAIQKATARIVAIQKMYQTNPGLSPITYDQQLRFGTVSFPGKGEKRYRFIGPAEVASVLSRLYRRQAAILTFISYDMNGYLKFRKEVGKAQGIDIMFGALGQTGRLTREDRVYLMRKYVNGKARANVKDTMARAYVALGQSVQNQEIAKVAIETEHDGDWLLEPEFFNARREVTGVALENLKAMTLTPGPVTLYSALSKEPVEVNLYAYFHNPVENMKDLLPLDDEKAYDHSEGEVLRSSTAVCNGKPCEYRNYFFGRAIGWDIAKYKERIFPAVKTSNDIMKAMDVLSEARGGRMAANFLMPFVR